MAKEKSAAKSEKSPFCLLGLLTVMLLLTGACATQTRVAAPVQTSPEKVEVVVPEQQSPVVDRTAPPASGQKELTPESAAMPQIVVKERYILPDPRMYAARYQHYQELKEKYDELLFHQDWISTEETSPELGQCIADLSRIVEGYGRVVANNNEVAAGEKQVDGGQPWQVVWQDLAFVQGPCPSFYQEKIKEIAGHLKEYSGEAASRAGEMVSGYTGQQNDAKAVESFKYLTENFPEWKRDPAILKQYGEALLRQGNLQEAGAIFSELLGDPAPIKETIGLYRKSADLLLAVGKTEDAARQFHALREIELAAADRTDTTDASLDLLEGRQTREPLLSIYQNFLWEYYSYDGKQLSTKASTTLSQLENFFPDNPLTDNAKRLFADMVNKVRSAVNARLAAATSLAEEKKFDQAKETLAAIKTDGLPSELADKVRFKIQEIAFDEQEEQKSSAWAQKQELEQLWQQASLAFDQHKFDDAIAACSVFVGTEYEQQAAALITKAVEQAAVDLRKQAAAFYLRARKEKDPSLRSGYLQESLALLRQIEGKYPQAKVIEKVKSNIAVLEGELETLGMDASDSEVVR